MIGKIASNFAVDGKFIAYEVYGNGHINETYALTYKSNCGMERYILQKVNKYVFPNMEKLMNNITGICEFLKQKYQSIGQDATKKCITIVYTLDGKSYYTDLNGDYWRMMRLIEDTESYEIVVDNVAFEKAGHAFGEFISLLKDYPVDTLYEVIPNFHNTVSRFEAFASSVKANKAKRKKTCKKEIQFVYDHKHLAGVIVNLLNNGDIPTRVTHNDTKINNVLMDRDTGDAVCVVDLDTIMPGSLLYDFGDGIRSGCNTGYEDDKNLDNVDFDMDKFESFAKGFITGANGDITKCEKDHMAIASIIITFECGIRFLTDYLNGDVYFKTSYPEHNLVRCRTQFKLVARMLERYDEMRAIVSKY